MENKGDVIVGVYYQLPSQDVSTDKLFYRQYRRHFWICSPCPYRKFQLPRHQQGISYCCDKHVLEILEVCRR